MSGGVNFTTVGRDAMVRYIMEHASYFKLGEGGFILSGETIEVIDAGAVGGTNVYDYIISGGDFSIISVNLVSNYFEIAGEYADFFPDFSRIKVEGSTDNDGFYTIAAGGVVEIGGNTRITVEETIPDATADGLLYVDHRPIAIGPTSDTRHWPMVVEEVTPALVVVQSITDTTGYGDLTGDGDATINYKTGALHVEFAANVTAGNIVRTRFKYHDRRMDPATGLGYTDLESANSPIALDGLHELYTYEKEFGADVDTYIEFRGVGYATIRAHLKAQTFEGIDDGRGGTYGGIPYYFEGGIFDENDVLLAYFTFDKERKTGAVEIDHSVDFII